MPTIRFPWRTADASRFTHAFEDRKPIEHAGRQCVVLSRKLDSFHAPVMVFEIAYLAAEPVTRPSWNALKQGDVQVPIDADAGKLCDDNPILACAGRVRAASRAIVLSDETNLHGIPPLTWHDPKLPGAWTATGDRSCKSSDGVRCSVEGGAQDVFIDFDGAYDSVSIAPDVFRWLLRPSAPAQRPAPQPKRSPVAVTLGSLDSIVEQRGEARVIVVTHGDAQHWHTSAGTVFSRGGGSTYLLGLSPATDAMLSAYFDDAPTPTRSTPDLLAEVELLANEIDCSHVGLTDAEIVARLRALVPTPDAAKRTNTHGDFVYLRALAACYLAVDAGCPANPDGTGEWAIDDVVEAVSEMLDENRVTLKYAHEALDDHAEEAQRACETLAPYCPECDPSRTSLSGVVSLLVSDVLNPGRKLAEAHESTVTELAAIRTAIFNASPDTDPALKTLDALRDLARKAYNELVKTQAELAQAQRSHAGERELNRNANQILREALGSTDPGGHVVDAALVIARRLGLAELTREKIETAHGDELDAIGELLGRVRRVATFNTPGPNEYESDDNYRASLRYLFNARD